MTEDLRIVFVGRAAAHFSYYDSIISALLDRGAAVTLLLGRERSRSKTGDALAPIKAFQSKRPKLVFDWLTRRADAQRTRLFALRELRSYRPYLARAETTLFYTERWRGYLTRVWATRMQSPLWRATVTSPIGGWALDLAERQAPADAGIPADLRARRMRWC